MLDSIIDDENEFESDDIVVCDDVKPTVDSIHRTIIMVSHLADFT